MREKHPCYKEDYYASCKKEVVRVRVYIDTQPKHFLTFKNLAAKVYTHPSFRWSAVCAAVPLLLVFTFTHTEMKSYYK